MNKRICKIDPRHVLFGDNLCVRIEVSGRDPEGDSIRVELKDEDAAEFLELAQAIASQERRTTRQLIEALNEQRTIEAT